MLQSINQATVMELIHLSAPDWMVILVAFLAGGVAALMSACVPYYTGLIIDYASIDPDRWEVGAAWGGHGGGLGGGGARAGQGGWGGGG